MFGQNVRFILKGLGGGGGGVGSWVGMGLINYDGMDCEFFPCTLPQLWYMLYLFANIYYIYQQYTDMLRCYEQYTDMPP